jgi:NADP-dependent 3-hydroxy acid dehydrogenase YdfG
VSDNEERIQNLSNALTQALDEYAAATTVQQKAACAKVVEQLKNALAAAQMLENSARQAHEWQEKLQERNRREAHSIKTDYNWLIMKPATEPVKYFTEYQKGVAAT